MGKSPPLYVVIATHERPALLRRTLDSLAECVQPESYQATIVVENGSKAGTEEIARAHEETLNAKYLFTPRGNKSHALNVVLEEIEEGLIFFTDDDVRVHPKILVHYAEAATSSVGGAFFGGTVDTDYEGGSPPDWMTSSLPPSAVGWNGPEQEHHPYFIGVNWAAFTTDLRRAGGFNEKIGPGTDSTGQETEMQKRLLERGAEQVFVAGAKVWHYVPRERCRPGWLFKRKYREGVEYAQTAKKALPEIASSALRKSTRSVYAIGRQLLKGEARRGLILFAQLCRHVGVMYGAARRAWEDKS